MTLPDGPFGEQWELVLDTERRAAGRGPGAARTPAPSES